MSKKYRGTELSEELDTQQTRLDTRSLSRKAHDFFSTTDGVVAAMIVLPILALFLVKVPLSGELLVFFLWRFHAKFVSLPIDPEFRKKEKTEVPKKRFDFPYRVPFFAKLFDASYEGKKLGEGITFIGKEISTKLEIWTGNSDLRTHMLVLGTTGSGKTEFLLGLVYNALVQNSGAIYTDGKGDVSLYFNIFRLARYLGREDDLLAINFLTSGRDFLDKQPDRSTNTMNPFALGSSGMLIELIIALMDDSGGGGDMWKGRAIAFVSGQTRVLCFLRDRGYLLLDSSTFIQYFELPVIERLVWDKKITVDGTEVEITDPLFSTVTKPLEAYLLTLPGYSRDKKGGQEQKTVEQHGFITMQLTRLFGDMSFTYGYLFQTTLGDVDMYDVVINRRILVVMLPALERAPDSLKMLGKLIVGSIKQMMAGCLGNRLEGLVREVIDARPTNADVPFYVILDEYGYYAVLGFAVAPAQARSLGFAITFAAQDFSSLQKASKEEADATWENTNVRLVGRVTSGQESETYRRIRGLAGEALVQQGGGKEFSRGDFFDSYVTVRDTRPERVARVEFDDFAQQENGEFHVFVGKKHGGGRGGVRVIRARTFYIQVQERPNWLRLNRFLKVEPPKTGSVDQDLQVIDALEDAFKDLFTSGELAKIFPDNALTMAAGNKQPSTLLQIAEYVRSAQVDYKLPLRDAMKVAFVCMTKSIEIMQQAQLLEIQAQVAAAKTTVDPLGDSVAAAIADDQQNLGAAIEAVLDGPVLVDTVPAAAAVAEPSTADLISSFIDGYELDETIKSEPQPSTAASAEPAVSESISSVSLLTLRNLDSNEPNDLSAYIEEKIADADVLIGNDSNLLDIRGQAKEAVRSLEVATSYVDCVSPEPVELPSFDALLEDLAADAQRTQTDFDQ